MVLYIPVWYIYTYMYPYILYIREASTSDYIGDAYGYNSETGKSFFSIKNQAFLFITFLFFFKVFSIC